MTLNEWQGLVDQWINKYGIRYFEIKTNTLLLAEELGEFSRLVARIYGEQSFKNKKEELDSKDKLKDELADIFFVLTCIANQLDINIETELDKNLSKKSIRDLRRHHDNKKLE
jgi:NTP pyrophosphatase (non-canonical NTP hydrolase)